MSEKVTLLNNSTAIASLIVGGLGFLSAIITLIFNAHNNNRNFELQAKINSLQNEKENREKSKAYNRVLGNLLKLFHSYVKHKQLLDENGVNNIPDNYLLQILDEIDSFENEIERFNIVANNETEIIPELTMQLHQLLEVLNRFLFMSKQFRDNESDSYLQDNKLILKRAFVYSICEFLDDMFNDVINELSQKAETTNEFKILIAQFNSEKTIKKSIEIQEKLTKRLLESLSRQLGKEVTKEELFF